MFLGVGEIQGGIALPARNHLAGGGWRARIGRAPTNCPERESGWFRCSAPRGPHPRGNSSSCRAAVRGLASGLTIRSSRRPNRYAIGPRLNSGVRPVVRSVCFGPLAGRCRFWASRTFRAGSRCPRATTSRMPRVVPRSVRHRPTALSGRSAAFGSPRSAGTTAAAILPLAQPQSGA